MTQQAFTRIYTHVLNKPSIGVKSPLDCALNRPQAGDYNIYRT